MIEMRQVININKEDFEDLKNLLTITKSSNIDSIRLLKNKVDILGINNFHSIKYYKQVQEFLNKYYIFNLNDFNNQFASDVKISLEKEKINSRINDFFLLPAVCTGVCGVAASNAYDQQIAEATPGSIDYIILQGYKAVYFRGCYDCCIGTIQNC